MKKFVKIIAVALVLVTFAGLLVSCGKTLNGTYVAELSAKDIAGDIGIDASVIEALSSFGNASVSRKYEFSGNKVTETVSYELPIIGEKSASTEYTYKIAKNDEGKLEIAFTKVVNDKDVTATFPFEELDDGNIKIAGITYNIKK